MMYQNYYYISLLQFLFCKSTGNVKECMAAIIKKGRITVWIAAVEFPISFEKRNNCKCLFQRNTVPGINASGVRKQ